MTPSATSRIDLRRSMAVFWIQRNASALVRPRLSWEQTLRLIDDLAGRKTLFEVLDLIVERPDLGETRHGDLDRRTTSEASNGFTT